ncbi:DNA damage-inducible transcript 4-like protein [Erythrolamprus reginae]|uniref:DNA damage-inducible transcript 4-like protein n=1 Tax=Erythrolamprus reginae TaxID=121349 RepID=UPI00396CC530
MHFFRMVATNNLNNKNSELIQQRFQQASFTDFDYWDFIAPEPNFNEMVFEERTCQDLIRLLENSLSKSKQTRLHCSRVLIPEKLTRRIAQDVLRLSATEPCGLRGCVIHVNLETGNVCKRLDKIVFEPSITPTFELTLVFKQDHCSWPSFRSLFPRVCFSSSYKQTLILSPGFRLIKKKLYSLIGTVVEEC